MATKKEVNDLQDEVVRLNNIIINLNQELSNETKAKQDLINRNNDLTYWNSNLQDQLARCNSSKITSEKLCTNLMISIAYLGQELHSKDSIKDYHLCYSAFKVKSQAMEATTKEKDLNNYFDANS